MDIIKSKNNNIIKDLIKIRDSSKSRNDKSLFYIEGERIFKDTPKNLIEKIFIKESDFEVYKKILTNDEIKKTFIVDDSIYNHIKGTVNSQGIIATVQYNLLKEINDNIISKTKNCIVLDNISDPGNLGTIIRLSEAANINLIILTNNCCNIYNPKVIRSSMSSIFRVNLYLSNNIDEMLKCFHKNNFNIYATSLNTSSINFTNANFKSKNLIVFGNEANGISTNILNKIEKCIKIPMKGQIESLNVSLAVAIIGYEIMRQNNYYETKS